MSDFTEIADNVRRASLPRDPLLAAAAMVDYVCDALIRQPFDIRAHTEQQRQRGHDEVNGQPVEWK